MKVASVDRIGSWRPPNADARAVTASRLQTIASDTANSVEPQALSSARELPPLPVQKTTETMSRPVLQSDPAAAVMQHLANATVSSSSAPYGESVPTVDAYKGASTSSQTEQLSSAASGKPSKTSEGGTAKASPKSLLELAQAKQNPENLMALEIASQAAAARAAEQAKKEAAQPPQVPLSKMLMDQVKSLWDASGRAVEASLTPSPPPAAAKGASGSNGGAASSPVDITYTVPRHGGGPG